MLPEGFLSVVFRENKHLFISYYYEAMNQKEVSNFIISEVFALILTQNSSTSLPNFDGLPLLILIILCSVGCVL